MIAKRRSRGGNLLKKEPLVSMLAVPHFVRRLTPLECERLQGFPDGWTDVEYRGKPACDTPRYKALGNSMAVPVIRWIGKRMEANWACGHFSVPE